MQKQEGCSIKLFSVNKIHHGDEIVASISFGYYVVFENK